MNLDKSGLVDVAPLRLEIHQLPTYHPCRADGPCEPPDNPALSLRSLGQQRVLAENLERERLERIPREYRDRLVESPVGSRSSTAKVVVVHGGQVIVD